MRQRNNIHASYALAASYQTRPSVDFPYTCLSLILKPGLVSPGWLWWFPCSPIVPGRLEQASYLYKPECTTTAVGRPPTHTHTSHLHLSSLLSFSSNCCCPNINPATAGGAIKKKEREGGYISKGTRLCHAQKTKIVKGGYPTRRKQLWSYPGNAGLVLRGLGEGCRVVLAGL